MASGDVVEARRKFAAEVARDLQRSPKELQPHHLYDGLGSSLFEAICRLPWYGITRGEGRLLESHAREVAALAAGDAARAVLIAELGVGSGEKLATIVRQVPAERLAAIHLIDVSGAALDAAAARVAAGGDVVVMRCEGTYEEGLERLGGATGSAVRTLVLFLGSNIGNFDRAAAGRLLAGIRGALRGGDLLLLGADLVKPAGRLVLAYDDPLGVTAAFNKNLLLRINRELGGTFDLASFTHRAVWNAEARRVEMHLVSTRLQEVDIPGAGIRISFEAGESIWTESSYKYTGEEVVALAADAGFGSVRQWIDEESQFALTLLAAS